MTVEWWGVAHLMVCSFIAGFMARRKNRSVGLWATVLILDFEGGYQ